MKSLIWRLVIVAIIVLTVLAIVGTPIPVAAQQGAWYAEYFANQYLAGAPTIIRYEDDLGFEWGGGSPGAGLPTDGFSARWTRDNEWFEGGTYRFSYRSDDGMRIWVGDTLVVDDWRDREATWSFVDRVVPQGIHRVRVEYYEHGGNAAAQVKWERISGGTGWRAEYFANRDLSGAPVLVRYDPAVDFDWKGSSPGPAVPADKFSVRWTRTLGFTPGTYRFFASCDDGVRIAVDGTHVVYAWQDQILANVRSGDITLPGGQHTVVVEYYEHGGEASAHVWWKLLGAFGGWEGRYYDNAELRGGPALTRDDAAIDFDWGEGAPAEWMPSDSFSAVWTRQASFSPGHYRFNVRSDDGARVWLDGALVMDYWRPQDYAWHYQDNIYLEGVHTLKVAYFENAGNARIHFWWEPSGTAPSPAPSSPTSPVPAPTPVPTLPGPWRGEYFSNQDLMGSAILVRTDAAVDFSWGWEAPAVGMNRDEFSVRWSGTFPFEAGRYRFTTTTDDGVRLYVDDQRVVDAWRPMHGTSTGYATLVQGSHAVRVEYFERSQAAMARVTWQRVDVPVPVSPALMPASQPVMPCAGGPLRLDAWPVGQVCTADGGWAATVYVEGHGGDCRYTYSWEEQVQGGPIPGAMTFEIKSMNRGGAIVGEASVTSAGQTVGVKLHISPPNCR